MSKEPNEYVVQKAKDALVSDPRVGELGIELKLVGEDVFVEGIVATDERRAAIEEVLSTMLPDRRIHNEVEVEKIREPSSAEELS